MSDTVTFTIEVKSSDFNKLSKVYALLSGEGLKANVKGGAAANTAASGASAPASAEAPAKRKPGRPRKTAEAAAAPAAEVPAKRKPGRPRKNPVAVAAPAAPAKRGPGRPKKVQPVAEVSSQDPIERFSKWHAGQKGANGRGKFFTTGEIKDLLPQWEDAFDVYRTLGGSADARATKSWSIGRLRREAEALGRGGASDDKESSPAKAGAKKKAKASPKAKKPKAAAKAKAPKKAKAAPKAKAKSTRPRSRIKLRAAS